ncbi:FG-GAP repeat domain-containing protein [Planctomicrobium sp. SH664]|uniref:FG-GAP repeat domain-containing protein n=1 Tax=Planctomicrobium sp. SH664 TaxID=3448125 RepID=UPI003F5C3952
MQRSSVSTALSLALSDCVLATQAIRFSFACLFKCLVVWLGLELLAPVACEAQWARHTIDNSSRGADGTRLLDINGDGLIDIATGWEQGGQTRIMLHPGKDRVREEWPSCPVGRTKAVEDAVFADLDGDGAVDVISCCEGEERQIFICWSPEEKSRMLNPTAWTRTSLPAAAERMRWMYALPAQIDGNHGLDLFAGGKGPGAAIGWFEAPSQPRKLEDWTWHALRNCGWLMSLEAADMDGDGDLDLVFSDRRGDRKGVYWLERPQNQQELRQPWKEHVIGGVGEEQMFLTLADLDQDGLQDVLVATKPSAVTWFRRLDGSGERWESYTIPFDAVNGTAKAVSVGDIDLDGQLDLVISCETAQAPLHGLSWMSYEGSPMSGTWKTHPVGGVDGVKHDLCPLVDLDGDGDLDVITSEEVTGLGVVWYENPTR